MKCQEAEMICYLKQKCNECKFKVNTNKNIGYTIDFGFVISKTKGPYYIIQIDYQEKPNIISSQCLEKMKNIDQNADLKLNHST